MKKLYIQKRICFYIFVWVPIIILLSLLINNIFFKNIGSATAEECFFSRKEYSYADFSRELPERYRDLIPEREIAVLPMDDYMVYYVGYVRDIDDKNVKVAFIPMKIKNKRYYPLSVETFYDIEEFEDKNTRSVDCAFYSLHYTILPANSPQIKNYDPETFSFVNANYTDLSGVKQDIIFCYTYEINWKPGDGSFSDEF